MKKTRGAPEVVLVLAIAGACNDYSEAPNDARDGGADTGGGVDATTGDAGADSPNDASDGSTGGCPGSGMLPVNAVTGAKYCIDVTEVTQSAYKKFIAATSTAPVSQPSECAFNTSFVPPATGCAQSTFTPDDTPDRPVTCVDWCDARAYCQWAGKRLCGSIGGGSVPAGSLFNAGVDQWYAACSKHGSQSFPYGNVYDETKCNGGKDGGTVANVGAYPQCIGGVDDALRDMVGNVAELEDSCEAIGAAPELHMCAVRGGGYDYGPSSDTTKYLRCDSAPGYMYVTRNFGTPNLGFRCCADL